MKKSNLYPISKSRLGTWLDCQLKFWYRYVLGIKPPHKVYLGTQLHKLIEQYLKSEAVETPNYLKQDWNNFLEMITILPRVELNIEERICIDKNNNIVDWNSKLGIYRGIIDLSYQDEEGNLVIIDWKRVYPNDYIARKELYAFAIYANLLLTKQSWKVNNKQIICLLGITNQNKYIRQKWGVSDVFRYMSEIMTIENQILKTTEPVANIGLHCEGCEYLAKCEYYEDILKLFLGGERKMLPCSDIDIYSVKNLPDDKIIDVYKKIKLVRLHLNAQEKLIKEQAKVAPIQADELKLSYGVSKSYSIADWTALYNSLTEQEKLALLQRVAYNDIVKLLGYDRIKNNIVEKERKTFIESGVSKCLNG